MREGFSPMGEPQRTIISPESPEVQREVQYIDAMKETENLVRDAIQDMDLLLEDTGRKDYRKLQKKDDSLRLLLGDIAGGDTQKAISFLRELRGEYDLEADRIYTERLSGIKKRYGNDYQGQDKEFEAMAVARNDFLEKVNKLDELITKLGGKAIN